MQTKLNLTSVYDVIDYINENAKTAVERGTWWEKAVVFYLRHDPEMRQIMGDVRLWADAPTNDGHDTGIDVVCEYDGSTFDESKRYWAVQCKNYDPTHKMDYKELSTFWAKAEADPRYAGYAIVSASDFSKNARAHAEKTGTLLITPEKMDESNVDWNSFISESGKANKETYDLREHQQRVVDAVNATFEDHDRCKAIMACGTGKTLMSLRLTEGRAPHGLILFAAPSIALVSQAMREWTNQARVGMRSLVVCSDAKASKADDYDDMLDTLADLAFPASTSPDALRQHHDYVRQVDPDAMVVVFSTYQSMQVIADAQAAGLPYFDLVICDEAHRTTGVNATPDEVTSYQIVLDQDRVHGTKRLFMTATPKIYGDKVRKTAREQDFVLASMDDEGLYGPTADEITFPYAVEHDLLCDYRVVVLAVREEAMPADLQRTLSDGSELQMDEAAKIIGCYKGLATHGVVSQQRIDKMTEPGSDEVPDFFLIDEIEDLEAVPELERDIEPLHRAVGFCRSIQDSKNINELFGHIVEKYNEDASDSEYYTLDCKLDHVDGTMNSKERLERLSWLASGTSQNECRILTNARCLAEGVDVPSLDAVIFFSPRKSEVDVVQAVGRVMRTFTNKVTGEVKEYGHIILPVFIPLGMSPEEALNSSKTFDVVWKVLQALRSHDERIEAYVNSIQFRKKKGQGTGIGKTGRGGEGGTETVDEPTQLQMSFSERLAEAIYTKSVEKVGTRIYWDSWAEDVAHIAERHIEQINDAIATDSVAREGFDAFLQGLRDSLNPGIPESDAIEMVAQHMITLPVFNALFADFQFAKSNPVSVAIDEFLAQLEGHGVGEVDPEDERALKELYASVSRRAKMVRTDNGRQALIKNLYEEFFKKAFRGKTDKYGIIYTPDQVASYILHATDRVLRREFGKSLADEGVHILDPFAGTGTFMASLIEDEKLMPLEKLPHKYARELHSNEILLLAYYVMVVNIEYAYHARTGEYREFEGALLADTFQMTEDDNKIDDDFFQDNSLRMLEQMGLDITVVLGNPPYSSGQNNANDNNANEHYPTLDDRIRQTYSAGSRATNKNSIMDSYIRAFRWASDRIVRNGDRGVICYVSNAGWIRSAAGEGVRRAFVDEFNSIYVLDLRGNQRTQGEESRKEGGKVFGSGSRAPIAVTMLVKNPDSKEHGVIHYVDVGDYKTQAEKLEFAQECAVQEPEWTIITPDSHGDWLNQRDESFYRLAPMGMQIGSKKTPNGLFSTWSRGVSTAKDYWVWGYSPDSVKSNVAGLIERINETVRNAGGSTEAVDYDSTKYTWNRTTLGFVKRGEELPFVPESVVIGSYRPFNRQWLYSHAKMMDMNYLQDRLFPLIDDSKQAENYVIVTTVGAKSSSLVTSQEADLHFVGDSQCFPLYWYEKDEGTSLFAGDGEKVVRDTWGNRYVRHYAITDRTLAVFQAAYPTAFSNRAKYKGGPGINKEDIFYYVYGILHSPVYRDKYAANLAKELPRIPLTRHFEEFSDAGRELARLHLHYEELDPWPTVSADILPGTDPGRVEKIRWAKKRDPETGKRVNDYTKLEYNKSVTITGIPEEAQGYVINGRSPLDWVIDRYQVKTDKKSGITNDPNKYSDNPWYIIDLIVRLVRVSMETLQIVQSLPTGIDEIEHPTNWPLEWTVTK